MEAKLIKLEVKLNKLITQHEELVKDEFILDDKRTDLEIEGKNTTSLDNKLEKILDKCYENTEKQEETKRLIKNLKAKLKRKNEKS